MMEFIPNRAVHSAEQDFLEADRLKTLYTAVLCLPEIFRLPIILHYYEDLSAEQIGQIVGKSTGTIKSRLSRGRERLRRLCKEEVYGEPIESNKASV